METETSNNDFVPRIRTISQAADMILAADPDTAISEYAIRKLANKIKIRSLVSGSKIMVDYDSLVACISGQPYSFPPEQIQI